MKQICWILMVAALSLGTLAQTKENNPPANPPPPELPRFDIDFPGGSPQELVAALNKHLQGTLNVILPSDDSTKYEIPPLRLRNVNVSQIFEALQNTRISFRDSRSVRAYTQSFDFIHPGKTIDTNTVWALNIVQPFPVNPDSTRFYQLGEYLNDLKIDDIITAIQTGFKMQDNGPGPNLKFHPETKLLIAVGKFSDFSIIDSVLKELARAPKPDRRGILILGNVNRPGPAPLPKSQTSISELLQLAGGPKSQTQSTFRIWRENSPKFVIRFNPGGGRSPIVPQLNDADVIEILPDAEPASDK